MVVSHEIEAYISVGINPISYLVVPRVLGVTISVMALTIYFNFFGLFGSFLVSQLIKPVPFLEYFSALLRTSSSATSFPRCSRASSSVSSSPSWPRSRDSR